ncbi:hypothetical protein HY486_03190 [Candidatus Woesearchaeota archaeon]|nr:hypothetical protein [Candidatus Woesearchaeota archaeon]
MRDHQSVAKLVNALSGRTLEQEVSMLNTNIQTARPPSFIMGYCAADASTFEQVFRYIQEKVAPQAQHPMEVVLEPDLRNLREYFLQHKEEMQSATGGMVLVKVKGFERLSALATQSGISYRVAHDYDQDVCEDSKVTFAGLAKKVLVITHIDLSSGKDAYDAAVQSACQSKFKSFRYEFKEHV